MHTPTPWKSYRRNVYAHAIHGAMGTAAESIIASVTFGLDTETSQQQAENARDNAALIVKAVNSYEAMRQALDDMRIFAEGLRDDWEAANPGREYNPLRLKLIAEAKAALALAEGKE